MTIEIMPIATATSGERTDWVALDDAAEWLSFSQMQGPSQWDSRLMVQGMHCSACGMHVEKALTSVPGVLRAEVNATSGRARVLWSSELTKPSIWLSAVEKAGYHALPAADALNQDERRKAKRLMLWRWLVAGLCMMQVMMYAYPAYVARAGEMSADMLNLMRWASWLLTLPVLLFSCAPFFKSAWQDLKRRQVSMDLPVALGILITFVVSSAATFEPQGWWGHEVYFDSLTMFVFFLLTGRWLELRLRDKTAGALEALMQRLPQSIEKQQADGSFERVAVRRIVAGDVIRVFAGEAFPADGEIIEGTSSADEALLTGESKPVAKELGAQVIAGSHNLGATLLVRVLQVGKSTQFAQIVALMEQVAVEKPRLALLADRIAKPFLLLVLATAALAAIGLWPLDHGRALMAAVAVLIVTCPCALSLATPAAMLTSAGALAKQGVLVRNLQALEALASIDSVVFDKTGTLTQDRMQITKVTVSDRLSQAQALAIAAAMAQHSLHPVSRALAQAAPSVDAALSLSQVQESAGLGLSAQVHLGAQDFGLLKLGSAAWCAVAAGEAGRVYLSDAQGVLASFELTEQIKKEAASVIAQLQASGLQLAVLSGDMPAAVAQVAARVGIREVHAQATPQSKLQHITALQNAGRHVLMVGDGLNDGPVLARADVSIAMGKAVPLTQAKSDFIVQSGELAMIPVLLAQARKTLRIVKQNLYWAAAYNAVCVPLAVVGLLPAWLAGLGMATSSLVVILNAARLSRTPLLTRQDM
jgi:P-type Cu2+ transporter